MYKSLPLIAGLALGATLAEAKTHVLTIGGGQAPSNNQLSLEKNILFFNKLVGEQLPQDTPHDVFFADGDSDLPDLQFQPKESNVPEANVLFAALYGSTRYLRLEYRDSELPHVNAASTPSAVEKWFSETGSTLQSGDRLVLYVTAHGGKGSTKKGENHHNTKIYTWYWQSLYAERLSELIAGLPKGVSVVTVMVQCYAGGFSHIIFDGNNAANADTDRDICGFFASVHNRPAAGCTPDINEEDYDEYSSHFWAALRGESRTGKPVASADYDGDGQVSFEEAHAYTLHTSKNIDVPVKTSDAFLRKHSELGDKEKPALLSTETPYFQLLTHANPSELAVLDALSKQLDLTGTDRAALARKRSEEIQAERKKLADEDKDKKRSFDGLKRTVANDLRFRWPELSNAHSPGAIKLLTEHSDEFVKAVKSHPKYEEWNNLGKRRSEIGKQRFDLDKTWARHQRFIRVLENIAFTQNLPHVATPEVVERFEKLVAAERRNLRVLPAAPSLAAGAQPTESTPTAPADRTEADPCPVSPPTP